MFVTGVRGQPLHGERMATSLTDAAWLGWIGNLMDASAGRESDSPKDSEDFGCLLDGQPSHLVPERLLRGLGNVGTDELSFNPWCHLPGPGELVGGLAEASRTLPNGGQANSRLVWVQDAETESWQPYWVSPELEETTRRVQRDATEIGNLSSQVRSLFKQAEILVGRNDVAERRARWKHTVENCRRKFYADGYAPIAGLIHPFQLGELRRYFRRQIRTGRVRLGDGQSPLRYIAHNDPATRFFHGQLTKVVSDLVGEPVKPSYVYMASYQSGARLEHHKDRTQCEFSVTLCLDYAPEPSGASPWPLYLETRTGTATIYQALGDGLLYRGRDLPHYRKTLAPGHTSTSIFFHYVAEDFDGPLE
jgi:hypothetical protein